MSVKTSEPQSNLDTYAYVLNVIVMVIAVISIFVATYFLERIVNYSYYLVPAISLLITSMICIFFAVNGIFFFIKVYGLAKKGVPILIVLSMIMIFAGIVFGLLSLDWVVITNQIQNVNIIADLQGLILSSYLIYLGLVLLFRAIAAREKKSAW